MFLAEEAVKTNDSVGWITAYGFDVLMILFTLVIGIGVVRTLMAPKKNLFAIGFGVVCLGVFLLADVLMVLSWFGVLAELQG